MRIPEEKINEILRSTNIVDIISNHIRLSKRGKNYIGLCPFHNEKTPSFTVSSDKQIFHCFGCHAGGNSYKFLMDYKNISFVEAVQEIAEQYSIPLEVEENVQSAQTSILESYYDVNVFAAKFFSENLYNNPESKKAKDYLSNRKIKLSIQRMFGLGYAPQGWDNFLKHATKNNIDLSIAHSLGLIDKKSGSEFYDKFRDRIIFPIFSPNGRVIAFGGRILEKNENTAKYLNSPESDIYQKRKVLYGLFHSKDEIRTLNKAILVEGYMDLISLFQNEIKNVVASSGTALTNEQITLLSRYTKNIIILFDSDNAGQKAALRSIELLLEQDFEVKVLVLPNGEDPDSFIQKNGKKEFEELVVKAMHFLEYQAYQYKELGYFDDPIKSTEAIRNIIKTIVLIKDKLKRDLFIKDIAKKFNLREKLIEEEAAKLMKENQLLPERKITSTITAEIKKKEIKKKYVHPREKEIIALLFEGDEKITGFIFDNILPEDFSSEEFQKISDLVLSEFKNNNFLPSSLIEKIEDANLKSYLLKIITTHQAISRKWGETNLLSANKEKLYQYASDVIKSYLIKQLDDSISENQKILATLTEENEIMEILQIIKEISSEKVQLLSKNIFS